MDHQTKQKKAYNKGQRDQLIARIYDSGKPWAHPDKYGQWHTGLEPVTASSATRFTSTGPSKRTRRKRAAKALRGRK